MTLSGAAPPTGGSGPRVLAAPARHHDLRKLARRERRAGSLWLVPALFGAGALIVAAITIGIDDHFDFQGRSDRFLVGDTNTARTLTSVVATGMLAFLGIVFATTLVSIQLAASQYSPRAVRVFVRSRLTKLALGVFVATFVFSVVTLVAIQSAEGSDAAFTPVVSTAGVCVLVLATMVAFLLFANGTARLLRVQYLVERIADDTWPALVEAFPLGPDLVEAPRPAAGSPDLVVTAPTHGVVDAVDVGELASVGGANDGWIEVTVPVGSYVSAGAPIAIVHPGTGRRAGQDEVTRRVGECLLLTNERTLLQDPGFGLRQLVDIASRALSPSVNDPTTAVQVVDRLTDLLGRVVARPDPSGWYADEAGAVRVRVQQESVDALVVLAFTEIIRYGADSPQVVRRLRASLEELQVRAGDERPGLRQMGELLDATVEELMPPPFAALVSRPDVRGMG